MAYQEEPYSFPNGLTVRDLKKIIADWPEEKSDGELTEVWVEMVGLSNMVHGIWRLNPDSNGAADLSLTIDPE